MRDFCRNLVSGVVRSEKKKKTGKREKEICDLPSDFAVFIE
jgi:hypothetical protein